MISRTIATYREAERRMNLMFIDVRKLDDAIFIKRTTKDALASACGIDRSTLYRRLKNGTLRVKDAHNICGFLNLTDTEAREIFLAK